MFTLQQIKATRQNLPIRMLLHGQPKSGKSTFSSQAPSPIFLQAESGLDAIDAQAFPLARSWQDILDAVTSLYQEDHQFKTVVLDSCDWADRLAHEQVCKDHGVKGIESIGYGRGWSFAADMWSELLGGLTALRDQKGMNIILISHSEIKSFADPQGPAYDRWQTKLHKLVGKMLSEYADVIAFAQIETIAKTEKGKGFADEGRTRALTTGRHVLMLAPSPAFEAGSRFNLPPSVSLEWGEFQAVLDAAKQK